MPFTMPRTLRCLFCLEMFLFSLFIIILITSYQKSCPPCGLRLRRYNGFHIRDKALLVVLLLSLLRTDQHFPLIFLKLVLLDSAYPCPLLPLLVLLNLLEFRTLLDVNILELVQVCCLALTLYNLHRKL